MQKTNAPQRHRGTEKSTEKTETGACRIENGSRTPSSIRYPPCSLPLCASVSLWRISRSAQRTHVRDELRDALFGLGGVGVPAFFGLQAVPAVVAVLAEHVHALGERQVALAEQ